MDVSHAVSAPIPPYPQISADSQRSSSFIKPHQPSSTTRHFFLVRLERWEWRRQRSPSPAERSASPSRCRRIDGGKRRRAGRRRPKRFETSRSESCRAGPVGVQGGRDALVASVRPPDFTTEHTERPTAVTEYTEALEMQGHGGGGPRSSVSSVCREAASVCSVAKKVAKVLQ